MWVYWYSRRIKNHKSNNCYDTCFTKRKLFKRIKKHCGDPIYKINQWWEKIKVKNNIHLAKALSEILHLPYKFILKQGWVWMVDVKKKSNYKELSPEEQKSLNTQIEFMIRKKYKFMNYNGIRNKDLNDLINEYCDFDIEEEYNGKEEDKDDYYDNLVETKKCKNRIDNKVIIIDEAHNFVSRIVNKLKTKKDFIHKII